MWQWCDKMTCNKGLPNFSEVLREFQQKNNVCTKVKLFHNYSYGNKLPTEYLFMMSKWKYFLLTGSIIKIYTNKYSFIERKKERLRDSVYLCKWTVDIKFLLPVPLEWISFINPSKLINF